MLSPLHINNKKTMSSTAVKYLFQFVFVLVLAGCTSLREYQGADQGTVVVSIGQPGDSRGLTPSLFVRREGSKDFVEVTHQAWKKSPGDFTNDVGMGMVHTMNLAPGAYEIYQFQYQHGRTDIGKSTTSFTPIRFVIEPGKVTYAGNYLVSIVIIDTDQMKTTGAVTVAPVGALALKIEAVNTRALDMPTAVAMNPSLGTKAIRDDAPKGNPVFRYRL